MKKQVIVLGIGAVLVAAAVTAVILVWVHSGGDNSAADTQSPPSSTSQTPFTLPQADVTALEAGLASTDPADEAKVLAAAVRAKATLSSQSLLPAGSKVAIDAGTATSYGDVAQVQATVSGPNSGTYMLLLIKEGGSWLLYGTVQTA